MQPTPLHVMDSVGPALGAVGFVLLMSLVKEPVRHRLNAVAVAGTAGLYISGGFGPWELLYPVVLTPVAYLALDSYAFVGLALVMHAAWDIVHHRWGNPIWPFMPTSSWGCMIFDSLIAVWFFAGAPTLLPIARSTQRSQSAP
jgi:hypothetical protein